MLNIKRIMSMKMILNILLIIIVVICGSAYMAGHIQNNQIDYFNDGYLHVWNGGLSLNFLLIYLIAITQICIIPSYERVNNGFDKLMILRIGYQKYYLTEYAKIFVKGIACCLMIHVLLIACTILKFGFFMGKDISVLQYTLFNNSAYLNIVYFAILSAIGTGVFCISIFSVSYLIKNKYLYLFLPFLTLFISIMVTSMFSGLLQKAFGYEEFIKTIGAMFMPTGLLQPGMAFMMAPFVNFFTSFLVYGTITICLYLYTIKKRKQYD